MLGTLLVCAAATIAVGLVDPAIGALAVVGSVLCVAESTGVF